MEGKRGSECLLKSVSNIDFNPLLLVNGSGVQTIRRTTIKGQVILIIYSEQEHYFQLTILTKHKKSGLQKYYYGSNPFGMSVTTRKIGNKEPCILHYN
ncbi:hypothetical protein [Pediococcus ethanolidurans]